VWLRKIESDRLRNLKAVSVHLDAGMTVLSGLNGQGKSSILESIYLLATGRSFRTRKLDELVAWTGGPMRVAGEYEWRGGGSNLAVIQDGPERALLVDGLNLPFEEYIGRLGMVDLTAQRMQVLRGGPEERRRFLDRGIVGLSPSFLRILGEYRQIRAQRNALLRGMIGGRDSSRQLRAWDERLVQAAARIHRARREYAVLLAGKLGDPCRRLYPDGIDLTLRYLPSPASCRDSDPSGYESILMAALEKNRERDIGLGFTASGPHRDDLVVEMDGTDLRKFGSAGQVRGAMVALKLAKLSRLQEDLEESPVFIMDDFDSDLDEERATILAKYLNTGDFQSIVATSKEEFAHRLPVPFRNVKVQDGTVSVTA
jgi:DNA replication and repair protein RecF